MTRKLLCLYMCCILLVSLSAPACALDALPCFGEGDEPQLWVVECQEEVHLWRNSYAGSYHAILHNGDTVQLLGWTRSYAYVAWEDFTGYIVASCLRPAELSDLESWLSIVGLPEVYSYEDMLEDLAQLRQLDSEVPVVLETIGFSGEGRQIPVLRIGREKAQYHVLLHGAIHGREYMTTWLLMALSEYWLRQGMGDWGDICFHIIPMVNPDGVHISQSGQLSQAQESIYSNDRLHYSDLGSREEYIRRWKANGSGVDLNKNFSAGWWRLWTREAPSSELYKGKSAFCATESAALRDYTLRYDFSATFSYHASGSVIFYDYGGNTKCNRLSRSLAQAVEAITGYPLESSGNSSGAGYKDWAIAELSIPSLTIEVGVEEAPMAPVEGYSIFIRNLQIFSTAASWLHENIRPTLYWPDYTRPVARLLPGNRLLP